MVESTAGQKNIYRQVEQIQISDIKYPYKLFDSIRSKKLEWKSTASTNFHDRVRSDMIAKAIEGLIKKTSLKKLKIH